MPKSLKEKITEKLSPKLYWFLAGLIQPLSAAIEGVSSSKVFYKSGNYELGLFKKLKSIKKGDVTLEIGCGPGRIQKALVLSKLNLGVYGTDFSASMIGKAIENVPGANFTLGNGKNLKQYEDCFFDLVYSFVVFQHTNEKNFNSYLKEAKRVLKNTGYLVFQIPSSEGMKSYTRPETHPWKLRRYTRDEVILKLKKAGFTGIKIYDMEGKPNPKQVGESGFLFLARKS